MYLSPVSLIGIAVPGAPPNARIARAPSAAGKCGVKRLLL